MTNRAMSRLAARLLRRTARAAAATTATSRHDKVASTADMKPTTNMPDLTSNKLVSQNSPASDQEKLLRRQLVIRKRNFDIRNKYGLMLDPDQPSFILGDSSSFVTICCSTTNRVHTYTHVDVCKELDRTSLRTIKDTVWPPHYVTYKDANGTVRGLLLLAHMTHLTLSTLADTVGLFVPES